MLDMLGGVDACGAEQTKLKLPEKVEVIVVLGGEVARK